MNTTELKAKIEELLDSKIIFSTSFLVRKFDIPFKLAFDTLNEMEKERSVVYIETGKNKGLYISANHTETKYKKCPSCESSNIEYTEGYYWNCNECSYEWGSFS